MHTGAVTFLSISMSAVLITGATGFIGGEILKKYTQQKVYVLTHKHIGQNSGVSNVVYVKGDVVRRRLGLTEQLYTLLQSELTAILHCAADTNFSATNISAKRTNVEGTRNIIMLAKSCRNLCKVGVLSTAYVAGRKSGEVDESWLDGSAGFINAYEESKFHMEVLLRNEMSSVPIAIYRPSTIIGSSRSGIVRQFNVFHQALRLYYNGFIPMVPGIPTGTVDLISTDYCVDAVHYLFEKKFIAGCTHHITAGQSLSMTLEELLTSTHLLFSQLDPNWANRGIEIPPIVSEDTYSDFVGAIATTNNKILKQFAHSMRHFLPQLNYPKVFSNHLTVSILRRAGIEEIPLDRYYAKIIKYCIASQWGRKIAHEPAL